MSRRNKEASSSGNNSASTLISRIDVQELRAIKVSLRRFNVPETANPPATQRNLEDPYDLDVHRQGEGLRPLFDRDDVTVNQVEEERVVLTSQTFNVDSHKSSPPRRRSRDSESRSRSRSISHHSRRRFSRSRSRSRGRDRTGSPGPSARKYVKKLETDGRYGNKAKSRSRSPHRRRSPRYKESEARFRDERETVRPVKRPGEYIPPKKRDVTPTKSLPGPSQKSKSPGKSREVMKTASPRRYESRRRSGSPHRDYRGAERPRSRSPRRRDKLRSRSPHFERRRSRSPPYRSSRRYSRTPERERYGPRYDHRSSRYSPPGRRPPSPYGAGPSALAPQFQGDGIFIPSALLASSVIPGMFPRPMMGMHMKPRAMAPMDMFPGMYRPRPPIIYNQPYKPRAVAPKSVTTRTETETTPTTTVTSPATCSSSAVTTSLEVCRVSVPNVDVQESAIHTNDVDDD